ncbi:hypothetical protein [Sphingomonas faeni]|uniref:hypothetical protein n=1 Tax=Sphingomonas faeni TaxID=185950 RepID=UPI00335AD066
MNRTLNVHVRKDTWPAKGKLPAFPATFHKGLANYDLNIPAMLLFLGYLTTPTSSTGVSLSEFWAWVRYFAAVTSDSDMRLTRNFADLDAHQKTILSDDFGMGVPMLWLSERLSLDRVCDGRYFMQRFAADVDATANRTAKRGPNKTPDFVGRDTNGVWHVVECKGTQSGHDYSRNQLGDPWPLATGGVAQKRSIVFPRGHVGQRLVCGLSIGVQQGKFPSLLTVIDPEPEEPFKIAARQMEAADDAVTRGVMSKALRLAGFETTAEATASPLGRFPYSVRQQSKRSEEIRREGVEERDFRAREELDLAAGEATVFAGDGGYRGRERVFELPRPIQIDDGPVRRVIVRQGVSARVLSYLRARPTIEEPLSQADADWTEAVGRNVVKGDERSASMTIGSLFRSELFLD